MTTIGNSTRDRPTASWSRWCENSGPVKSGTIQPALTMKTAVIAPSAARMRKKSVEARRNASFLRSCSSISVKTGTNAADSAASAKRLRTTFGTWKAIVNAENAPLVREVGRRDDLAHEPRDPREPREDGEDEGVARNAPRRRPRGGGADGRLRARAGLLVRAHAAAWYGRGWP